MIKFVKIVRQVVLFFALSTLLSGHQAVQASTYTSTWKGTTSTWSTAGNWTNAPSLSAYPNDGANLFNVNIGSGSAQLTGAITILSLDLTGGAITSTASETLTSGSTNISGGTIEGDVHLSSGTSSTNGIVFSLDNSDAYIEGNAVLTNNGGAGGWDQSNSYLYGYGSAQLVNAAGATFTVTTSGNLYNEGSATFTNNGMLIVNPGSGNTFTNGFAIANTGTTSIESGEYSLTGGGTVSGTWTVDAGAVLSFDGGTFTVANSAPTFNGPVNITGGTITSSAANAFTAATIQISGGTIGGSVLVNSGTGAGNGLVLAINGDSYIQGNAVLTNNGVAGAWNGTNDPYLYGYGSAQLVNAAGATFTVTTSGNLYNEGSATFTNNGMLIVNPGSGNTFTNGFAIANTGTTSIESGEYSLTGGGTVSGTWTVDAGAVLSFDGGTFTVANSAPTFNGPVNITGGTITSGAANAFAAATIQISGGTIGGSVLVNSGAGAGNGLVLAINGDSYIQGNAVLTNNGGAGTWNGTDDPYIYGYGSAQLVNAAGATFTVATSGNLYNQASATFTNNGSLIVNPGSGNAFGTSFAFSNTGTTTVQSGEFDISGGGSNTGTLAVDSGAVLGFGGGTFYLDPGTYELDGTTNFNGGTVSVETPVTANGPVNLNNGSITSSSTNSFIAPTIQINGGTIEGSVLVSSESGAGNGLMLAINDYSYIEGNAVLTNNGGAGTWNGTNDPYLYGYGSAQLVNAAGATFTVTTSGELYNQDSATFTNNGSLIINPGSGNAFGTTFAFSNTGTTTVQSGEFDISAGGSNTGALTVDSGAVLGFGGGTFVLGGDYNLNGTLNVNGGELSTTGPVTNDGPVNLNGGTLDVEGTMVANGAVNFNSGSVISSSTNSFTAPIIQINGGNIEGSILVNSESGAGNGLMLAINDYSYIEGNAVLTNNGGAGTWNGTNDPYLFGYGSAQLVNAAGATFTVTTSGELYNQGSATFTNNGSLIINPGSGNAFGTTFAFSNTGTTTVQSGEFDISGGGSNTGALTVDSGAVLGFGGGTFVLGGDYNLNGTLNVNGGTLSTTGPVTNDGPVNLNGGTLDVEGTMVANGAVNFNSGSVISSSSTNSFTAPIIQINGGTIEGSVLVNSESGAGNGLILAINDYSYIEGNAVLTNNGGAGIWNGTSDPYLVGYDTAQLVNAAGATLAVTSVGLLYNAGSATFTNNGSLIINPGSGNAFGTTFAFSNTGTTTVQSGEFDISGGGSNTGALTVDSGAVLGFGGGTFVLRGDYNLNGTLNVNGGELSTTGPVTNNGPVNVTNGTLDVEGVMVANGPVTVNSGGTITSSGGDSFTAPTIQINGGTINGSVLVSSESGAGNGLMLTINDYSVIQGNAVLTNNGSAGTWNGTNDPYLYGYDSAQLVNAAGATLTVNGVGELVNEGSATFTNNGSLIINPGSGQTFTVGFAFNNTGTVQVNSGTLLLQGSVSALSGNTLTGGTWVVNGNSTLSIPGSSITTNEAAVTLSGANSTFSGINALADNEGSFGILNMRSFTTAGALLNSGTLTMGSTLSVSGSLSLLGTSRLEFEIGGIQSGSNYGSVTVNGNVSLGGLLEFNLIDGFASQLLNSNTFTLLTSTRTLSGSFSNVTDGERLTTENGQDSFIVNYGPGSLYPSDSVVLSNGISVVPEPSACYLALAAGVVLLYSRRRIGGLYSQK